MMRTVLFSELRYNGRRAIASALAIGICVAFVAVVLAGTATMRGFLADTVGARAAGASVVVTSGDPSNTPTLDPAVATALAALPQAGASTRQLDAYAAVEWPGLTTFTRLTALPQDPSMQWLDVSTGRLPTAADEVLVDAGTADGGGVAVGDRLVVKSAQADGTEGPATTVTVVGVARSRGPVLDSQRQIFAGYDLVSTVAGDRGPDAVMLAPAAGVSAQDLLDAASAAAPAATVRTAQEWVDAKAAELTGAVDVIGRVILGFTAIALLVALIVIGNTFTILLAQRTERLALLRCIGATPRQLRRSVAGEALVLGLVASLAGIAVAFGAVALATWVVAAQVDAAAGVHVVLSRSAFFVPLVAGVLLTVGASWLPTRRATRVAPLAALRPATVEQARRAGVIRTVVGVTTLVGGTAIVLAAALGAFGQTGGLVLGVVGGMACVLGVVGLGQVLVPAMVRFLGRPWRGRGTVGELAVLNTVRSPARAAATSTALFVGVGLITVLSVGGATTQAAALQEIDRLSPVDVSVETFSLSEQEMRALAADLRAVDGTQALALLWAQSVSLRPEGAPAPASPDAARYDAVLAGAPDDIAAVYRTGIAPSVGTALLPRGGRETYGLGPTQRLTLTGNTITGEEGGTVTLDVVEADVDRILITEQDVLTLDPASTLSTVLIRADDDVDARTYLDAVRQVTDRAGGDQVIVSGQLADRAFMVRLLSVMLSIATGLLGVAVLISLVGVGNTLSLAVLERTRESGLQRALGMTRRQLRRMLAVEALLLAGTGVLFGLLVGTALGWAGARVLLAGIADIGAPQLPWLRLGLVVVVALGAALLASVLPGRRASRVSPTQALAAV